MEEIGYYALPLETDDDDDIMHIFCYDFIEFDNATFSKTLWFMKSYELLE